MNREGDGSDVNCCPVDRSGMLDTGYEHGCCVTG